MSGVKCSVDLLARVAGEFCWFELKWTRRSLESPGLGSLQADDKVKTFSDIQRCLRDWTRVKEQGGGPVFPAQRLGKLLVNPFGFRLVWQHGEELSHSFDAQPSAQRKRRSGGSNWEAWNTSETAALNPCEKTYKKTEAGEDSVAASTATRHNIVRSIWGAHGRAIV